LLVQSAVLVFARGGYTFEESFSPFSAAAPNVLFRIYITYIMIPRQPRCYILLHSARCQTSTTGYSIENHIESAFQIPINYYTTYTHYRTVIASCNFFLSQFGQNLPRIFYVAKWYTYYNKFKSRSRRYRHSASRNRTRLCTSWRGSTAETTRFAYFFLITYHYRSARIGTNDFYQ